MNKLLKRLMVIKDVLWALGILICLIALLIGFMTAAISRYNGDTRAYTIDFGTLNIVDEGKAQVVPSAAVVVGNVKTVGKTADAGDSYINSLTILCDSDLIGLREMNIVNAQIWGSESGVLPISSVGTWNIVYSDGSKIKPSSAAMISKPSVLLLAIGSDSLADASESSFISGYTSLVQEIKSLSPYTNIVCCSILPVSSSYSGADGLNNDLISEANTWITRICIENDLLYCNIAEAVTASSGALTPDYSSADGKGLNIAGLQQITAYLRTHAVS